jgi:hypothetical protein
MTDLQIQLIKENERDIYWKIHQSEIKNIQSCKLNFIFSPFLQ